VYAAGNGSNAVAVFRRIADGPKRGQLRQLHGLDGCWSEDGHNGACRDGKALDHEWGSNGIALSPGGDTLYAASSQSNALAVFARRVPRRLDLPAVPEWDLAEDWADATDAGIVTNPTPDRDGAAAWSFLQGNGNARGEGRDPSTYTVMPSEVGSGERAEWRPAGNPDPVLYLTSGRRAVTHPANGLNTTPGVFRWTNTRTEPIAVDVHALVRDDNANCGDGISWFLDHGTTQLATGRIHNGGRAQSADRAVTVAPNGTIDLVVTPGPSGE
jgi:hypothetical protein